MPATASGIPPEHKNVRYSLRHFSCNGSDIFLFFSKQACISSASAVSSFAHRYSSKSIGYI